MNSECVRVSERVKAIEWKIKIDTETDRHTEKECEWGGALLKWRQKLNQIKWDITSSMSVVWVSKRLSHLAFSFHLLTFSQLFFACPIFPLSLSHIMFFSLLPLPSFLFPSFHHLKVTNLVILAPIFLFYVTILYCHACFHLFCDSLSLDVA